MIYRYKGTQKGERGTLEKKKEKVKKESVWRKKKKRPLHPGGNYQEKGSYQCQKNEYQERGPGLSEKEGRNGG